MDAPVAEHVETQVRTGEELVDSQRPILPYVSGEYLHPEQDVEMISRRHVVVLSVVLVLLALHVQLNRNWPGYYRRNTRVVGTSSLDTQRPTYYAYTDEQR